MTICKACYNFMISCTHSCNEVAEAKSNLYDSDDKETIRAGFDPTVVLSKLKHTEKALEVLEKRRKVNGNRSEMYFEWTFCHFDLTWARQLWILANYKHLKQQGIPQNVVCVNGEELLKLTLTSWRWFNALWGAPVTCQKRTVFANSDSDDSIGKTPFFLGFFLLHYCLPKRRMVHLFSRKSCKFISYRLVIQRVFLYCLTYRACLKYCPKPGDTIPFHFFITNIVNLNVNLDDS